MEGKEGRSRACLLTCVLHGNLTCVKETAGKEGGQVGRMQSSNLPTFQPSNLLLSLLIFWVSINGYADDDNFLTRMDRDIFDAIYDAPPQREPLGTVMKGITQFGDGKAIMGLSILLMAYGNEAHRETGRLMSSAFIGTGVVVLSMKELIRRKRPLDEQVGDPSFPSGHTGFAFAVATIFSHQYPQLRIPLYIGAGLVGLSRIYLGRHYASDVIVGAAVGTITGTLVLHHRATLLRWEF